MTYFLQLSAEDDFLSLFTMIWIEVISQLLILAKSLFSSFPDVFMSCAAENKCVSSANSLSSEERPVARSFM